MGCEILQYCERDRLRADNAALKARIAELEGDLRVVLADRHAAALDSEQQTARAEKAEAALEKAHIEHEEFRADVGALEDKLEGVEAALEKAEADCAEWMRKAHTLAIELNAAHQRLITSEADCKRAEARVAELVGQRDLDIRTINHHLAAIVETVTRAERAEALHEGAKERIDGYVIMLQRAEAERDTLREALEPFAQQADGRDHWPDGQVFTLNVAMRTLRKASAALNPSPAGQDGGPTHWRAVRDQSQGGEG